ncbi:contractile injection system protein, VgrG/Pvc8 family [Paraburkholderia sp. D1E]|uniref:contractile injection system protein, VgrG/Pvc8 family n=1 Tax=Paraburkholderia sp. D1E TaxID=3461398 RepID=UPI004045499A
MRDALSVLEGRTNTRIFRTLSVPDLIEKLLGEWQKKSPARARVRLRPVVAGSREVSGARDAVAVSRVGRGFHPAAVPSRGAAWFTAAGKRGAAPSANGAGESPVLLDDPMKLPKSSAGTVRYHRDATTEARDSITLWSASRQLVPGNVQRASWDYKSATVAQASETSIVDKGEAGNDIAQLLRDAVIDVPHAGDSWSDYERVSNPNMNFNGYIARCVAYAQALAALADILFPDASGGLLLFPEGRTPRRT